MDVEVAAHLARGYAMMLMGLRSDPRFWDEPDTRVTFQNVTCLAQALWDVAEAYALAGHPDRRARMLHVLDVTLLEFHEMYTRHTMGNLFGVAGWETTETAWFEALQSEVPHRSGYNVVRRATLVAVGPDCWREVTERTFVRGEAVADTGHIIGEVHGEWENQEWCEHRAS